MKAVQHALKNIRRTPYQTIASLMVMILTFFLLLLFLMASYGSNRILRHFEAQPKVSAYFTPEATEDDVNTVKSALQATGKTNNIRFISQEQALQIYNERFKDKPQLTEFVQKDFFPMSLDIKTNDPDDLESVAQTLRSYDTVEEVTFLRDDIQELLAWTRGVRIFGIVITSYAMVTSIFTILIVIGMKIASKKDEIEILGLLGATNWYIRAPFLVEGMFYGIVGATVAWLLGIVPFLYIQGPLSNFFQGENFSVFPPAPIFLAALLLIQIVNGVLIGLIGSFIALLRYLRN